MTATTQPKISDRGLSDQSAWYDPPGPKLLSAEILNTYTRRQAIFRQSATSTSSTTQAWDPVEETPTKNPDLWKPRFWIAETVRQSRFASETQSPSRSQGPDPHRLSLGDLIVYVKEQLKVPFNEQLARRLDQLVETSREDFPYQAPILPQSLQDFIDFLQSVPNLAYPDVVLTPHGNIRTEWRKARNQYFAVEFMGEGDVRFVVFAPDSKHFEKITRISGLTSVDSLMDLTGAYGVPEWASLP